MKADDVRERVFEKLKALGCERTAPQLSAELPGLALEQVGAALYERGRMKRVTSMLEDGFVRYWRVKA